MRGVPIAVVALFMFLAVQAAAFGGPLDQDDAGSGRDASHDDSAPVAVSFGTHTASLPAADRGDYFVLEPDADGWVRFDWPDDPVDWQALRPDGTPLLYAWEEDCAARVTMGERIMLVFRRSPFDPATVTAPGYSFSILAGPWRFQDDAGRGDDVDHYATPHVVGEGSWTGSSDGCDRSDAYRFDAPAHGRVRLHAEASGATPEWFFASASQLDEVWGMGPFDAANGARMTLEVVVAAGPVRIQGSAPFGSGPMAVTEYGLTLDFEAADPVDLAAVAEGHAVYEHRRTTERVLLDVRVENSAGGWANFGYCVTEPVPIDADVLGPCGDTRVQTVGPGSSAIFDAGVELERGEQAYRTYGVGVLIDSTDTWDEPDESNNLVEFQVTVAPVRCFDWLVRGGVC